MIPIFKILTFITIIIGCSSVTTKADNSANKVDYGRMIEEYLKTKKIEPTVMFNNDGRNEFVLLSYKIGWRELKTGIEITINGNQFTTSEKVTSNEVWGSGVDSVNFANHLQQIKIYDADSIIGFVLTYSPCNGLGCGVNYQIIFDLKSKRQTYFGRFRTGFEFELYNFNSDGQPDFLSKTFFGRNAEEIDTTEFVLYSRTENGEFKMYQNNKQRKFWFKHIYAEFQQDLNIEKFEEFWTEKIKK